ncbi:hypothetical protein [Colwellia psychrerythraea]|uniref:Uncharacterized protein n=1 Tax=Colwellia psychrerythraea TaxID=28229 RepID=A0A099KVZ4_COLPS|nr:hypothetical protein [Colwellia psychrerythraea]KGJ94022.1 hypothetical protein GAB14E_2577 [Colwellia psychrerythraea]
MKLQNLVIVCLTALLSTSALADTIVLMDDQKLTGKVVSIDNKSALFELGGQKIKLERTKIKSITFDQQTVEKPVGITTPTTANSLVGVVIPTSTPLLVKMTSTVNSSKHPAGYKFTARLEAAIVIDNEIIIPRRTIVYGVISESKKSSRLIGKSNMSIKFTAMLINDQLVPFSASDIKAVSESTTKDTVARTARFAAIGGLANGSEGAGNMVKAGLGVSLLTGGSSVNIPSGTLLEFSLTSPINF